MKPLNYVSSSAIISKLFRDAGLQDTDYVTDAVEWIGEALDAIGSFAQTVTKSSIVQTASHRTAIPAGTVSINAIYFTKDEIPTGETPTLEDFDYKLPYGSPDAHPAYIEEETDHPTTVDRTDYEESFLLDAGYIRTSFEADWILITYQAVNTDDNGFPMVPDGYEFSQALYWYVIYKMMESGWKHPAGLGYTDAEQRWLKYCSQARNNANMPSVAEAERFRDMWVGLLPSKAYESEVEINSEGVDASNLINNQGT